MTYYRDYDTCKSAVRDNKKPGAEWTMGRLQWSSRAAGAVLGAAERWQVQGDEDKG